VIRRAFVAIAIVVALLATLVLAPAAEARTDRKRGKARVEKQVEPGAETAKEEAKPVDNVAETRQALAFDNAAPVADNAAVAGAIHESDIPAAVATGRPLAQPPAPSEGPSFAWAAVKMVFALAIVLAMLLGVSHLMKKYMDRFGAGGGTAPGRAIAVTEARHVAPKTQVMVVEALGNRYLIGVTQTQVTLIDKVPAGRSEKGA
jgi:flagellar biosynthetic protein FliO